MASYTVVHQKAEAFYDTFERKAELQNQTHYCPGCGHGIVSKLLAQAIDELGVQDRTVLISPVGCSVFGYYYFDVGNVQVAHGRAPAVATAVKRSRPESIVIGYQGDGDLAAIGTAEIVHAANRGEPITVIFVNNGIYGMTGGQMAPTTPLGKKTATSPLGRDALNDGYPLHVCEMLNSLEAPVFIERVALGNNKQIMHAAKVLKRAVENQVKGLGFSFVEVLSPCPTIWKMQPVEAQRFVQDEMAAVFGLSNLRDRTKQAQARPLAAAAPALEDLPRLLGLVNGANGSGVDAVATHPPRELDLRIKVAGFGGQGVLMLGEVLAEAGLEAGYEVSWLPSYGPEMRSGTSNCHVRLGNHAIDSPLVSRPNVLLAMNEPSLRKFLPAVEEGGVVLYNGSEIPGDCVRCDVRMVVLPFTQLADEVGATKVGNIVMLGALLEATGILEQDRVVAALQRLVHPRFFELDLAALARGRQEFRESVADDYLWGV
jgi:2-oxoisovalerate ferredoxin oxidoreductase beta subunit